VVLKISECASPEFLEATGEATMESQNTRARLLARVSEDVSGTMSAAMGFIGDQLGLFKALGEAGPLTRFVVNPLRRN